MKFVQGLKIAHLALKHRQGKNHKTRIVCFVGSPVNTEEATLIKLAKKLKKEKVNVDIDMGFYSFAFHPDFGSAGSPGEHSIFV